MMIDHKGDFFFLRLSFIGWIVLDSITRGVTGIYSTPYMSCTESVFYDDISQNFALPYDGGGYSDSGRRYWK